MHVCTCIMWWILPLQLTHWQDQWRSFFTHRGYGGTNALVWANEWMMTSSTQGQLAHVLFRIRNNNPTTSISWTLFFFYTSHSGWGELSQIIVNGNEVSCCCRCRCLVLSTLLLSMSLFPVQVVFKMSLLFPFIVVHVGTLRQAS